MYHETENYVKSLETLTGKTIKMVEEEFLAYLSLQPYSRAVQEKIEAMVGISDS